ncbi:hypothetical protein GALMADRAFT_126825 [Galerina marginata CBS 339.88]|uniref:DUF4139 domain-containing protein n=1 Tax=Galerina marginata (strain CBS 339.88) TaxID=685588 RepID=A0A067SYK9_GALM3|nr:hypothetical protein GALMADRAFT_126825 [Galerina marginata CBS 339.88]
MATTAAPPSFEAGVNIINLDTTVASKISNVNLYSGRAEISRLYKFAAATGANKLVITCLPDVLENDTLRVEGRGAGIIHDVSVAFAPPVKPPTTSEALSALLSKKEELDYSIARCKRCLQGLEKYLGTLNVNHVEVSQVSAVVDNYDTTTAKFETRIMQLEKELVDVEAAIQTEKTNLQSQGALKPQLRKVATIGFFADQAGEFEIRLIYVVGSATWNATYDVRVSTQSKEVPVQIFYKAAILQSTGEIWNDVPLTLETASPSFGSALPSIYPWKLSVYKPPVPARKKSSMKVFRKGAPSSAPKTAEELEESDDDMGFGLFDDGPALDLGLSFAQVTSKGDLSATFLIPGLVTVPSDGTTHTFTIRNLDLQAKLSWISIPKHDTTTRLTAKISNNSDYTLIPGKANIYVDGSFISSINLPLVSPSETFDCPLGTDQSIRIVYQPRESKASKSGFYSKASNTTYSQRITIHNTKPATVNELIIIDQIPVSEDSQISVVLKAPRLTFPELGTLAGEPKVPPLVSVEDGVKAVWHDSSDTGDISALGKDGKLKWICSLPSQKKLNLLLQWEVSFPAQTVVVGLNTR